MNMRFFFFKLINTFDYVDMFLYIEPSLHPWDKVQLILVYKHFDVFLDEGNENIIELFFIDIHK